MLFSVLPEMYLEQLLAHSVSHCILRHNVISEKFLQSMCIFQVNVVRRVHRYKTKSSKGSSDGDSSNTASLASLPSTSGKHERTVKFNRTRFCKIQDFMQAELLRTFLSNK